MNDALKPYVGKLPKSILTEIEEKCPASKIKKVAAKALEEYEAAMISPGEAVGFSQGLLIPVSDFDHHTIELSYLPPVEPSTCEACPTGL